jgi:hypothetical protein
VLTLVLEVTMFARVVTWEGADPATLEATVEQIRESSAGAPPEGVPATDMILLTDAERGKSVIVVLFASEDDRRKGDETLNAMSPPIQDGMGRRTSVEMFDVAIKMPA